MRVYEADVVSASSGSDMGIMDWCQRGPGLEEAAFTVWNGPVLIIGIIPNHGEAVQVE